MSIAEQSVAEFIRDLAAGTPAPGGGAAAALAGAMAAALTTMVARLTVGKEKYAAVHPSMTALAEEQAPAAAAALQRCDADVAAFMQVMAAYRLPKSAQRTAAIQAGLQAATCVPLDTMRQALQAERAAHTAFVQGNANTRSDAASAYCLGRAAFQAALWNVAVNLATLQDAAFRDDCLRSVAELRRDEASLGTEMARAGLDPLQAYNLLV